MSFVEERIVTPDSPKGSEDPISGFSSLSPSPEPAEAVVEPEETLEVVEASSEGLELATVECKVNEEIESSEFETTDNWDEGVVDQVVDTADAMETIGI